MELKSGQELAHYSLLEKLGEGGMGVVWKATDTRLDREVAIKMLPEHLAADDGRRERFLREARTLASLNHSNVAAIYDTHEAPFPFLALEFVPGEDLFQRLQRGRLTLDEALDAARQIADGLAAAHEAGIVHRDLKPANVKQTPDGQIKVLDFGLARAVDSTPDSNDSSRAPVDSPTVTSTGSIAGMIVGTASYMSPEQARGKPVDRRADLWAFGCVLYEMLTGTRVFEGETMTDTLSAVISTEPDWEKLPAETPTAVRRLLRRCLQKDERRRLSDARDARIELDEATDEELDATPGSDASSASKLPAMIAVVGVVLAGLLGWFLGRGNASAPVTAGTRVVATVPVTDGSRPESDPALSPDGKLLAFVSDGDQGADIWVQRVGGQHPTNLTSDHAGWDGAPAFSPDGEQIAFASDRDGGGLFVMGASGEDVRRVAAEGNDPAWSPDGTRLVASEERLTTPQSRLSLSRVFIVDLADGQVTDVDVGPDGVAPVWSPDGTRIAFWAVSGGQRDLWTVRVDGSQLATVTQDAATDWGPAWAPDGQGLFFHSDRGGNPDIWFVPIDSSGAAAGDPVAVTTGTAPLVASSFSADGSRLVAAEEGVSSRLAAIGFDPDTERVVGPMRTLWESPATITQAALSPDGDLMIHSETRLRERLATYELSTGRRRRVIDDEFRNRGPRFSPDGEWVSFYSNRGGDYQTWLVRPDGSGLHAISEPGFAGSTWSPDGRIAAVHVTEPASRILRPDPDAVDERSLWIAEPDSLDGFQPGVWSPRGDRIAGGQVDADGSTQVAVLDLDTRERIPSGIAVAQLAALAWLDDGRRLLVAHPHLERAVIWDVTAGEIRPVPGLPADSELLFSPDHRTVYVLTRRTVGDVWMFDLQ